MDKASLILAKRSIAVNAMMSWGRFERLTLHRNWVIDWGKAMVGMSDRCGFHTAMAIIPVWTDLALIANTIYGLE
jgi:hypothetical protein